MKHAKNIALATGAACLLAACSSDAPSHLPNPVTLPVNAASTALENLSYNARRSKVQAFVNENHRFLIDEIALGGGPTLAEAMNLAQIDMEKRVDLNAQLSKDLFLYAEPEPLVVALMVHSG